MIFINKAFILVFLLVAFGLQGQSFAPAPNEPGSTALFKDSSVFVAWATDIILERGYLDIAQKDSGFVDFGSAENALGKAEGNSLDVVSLGDSGIAILSFALPIRDGNGPDFAIFENGFSDHYMELAFVEVSSNGTDFVRFPAQSEIPNDVQLGAFELSNCSLVHNLAGKYRQGYGTPFDLAELADSNVNIQAITHVKIISIAGSIDPKYAAYDVLGRIINDPYPTAFSSGGFDLDAVGVIHQGQLGLNETTFQATCFPNPFNENLRITVDAPTQIELFDTQGKLILEQAISGSTLFNWIDLDTGVYMVKIQQGDQQQMIRLLKMNSK